MAADRRRLREGSGAMAGVLLVLGIVVTLNAISQHRFHRWDWTASGLYSLSDRTGKILAGLKTDVGVTVLLQPGAEVYDEVRELLERYRAKSPRLKLEFLDPAREPARVEQILKKMGIDPRGDSTAVVFAAGERSRHVPLSELVDYDMSEAALGGAPKMKAFKGEIAFTSAILSVTEVRQKSVLFLSGHGEVPIDDAGPRGLSDLAQALRRENMRVGTTDVLGRGPLPEGTDLLVLAGPMRGFTPPEASALGGWIDGGGRLLALIDPPFSRDQVLQSLGVETVFREHGAALGDDIVLDPAQRLLFGTPETFAASDFPAHEITRDLKSTFLVLGLARSVSPVQPAPAGWAVSPLVRTTPAGWGERNLRELDKVGKDPSDMTGPVPVAVAAEKKTAGGGSARFVLVGDSDFAQNQFVTAYANLDFLLNAVHWLTGGEQQIGIAPREPEQVRLSMTAGQERAILFFVLLGLPGLAVTGGIVVGLFRRR